MSRIEQIITEIEEYIDSCKYQPLSSTKILVVKSDMEDLLRELRERIPDEVKKYQRMLSNKDAILANAEAEAQSLINNAQIQTKELVSEHEIMQRAYQEAHEIVTKATLQAQEILDSATMDANTIREGAIAYTDDMLANLQMIIEHSIDTNKAKYDSLLSSLNKDLDIVINNRMELNPNREEDIMVPSMEDSLPEELED
ncbi:MAG: ATP synthase F0 subunit B [Lachnospira sp.]|nr:ATP synthase F0 subunit B [Lachnospira sp.]